MILVGLGIFCLFRKKRALFFSFYRLCPRTEPENPAGEDINHIYGMYYFDGENGAKIDNEKIEVEDANDNYGT